MKPNLQKNIIKHYQISREFLLHLKKLKPLMCHHDDDDDDDDLLEVEQGEMGEKLQEGMWQ